MQFLFCCKFLIFTYAAHHPAMQYILHLPLPHHFCTAVHQEGWLCAHHGNMGHLKKLIRKYWKMMELLFCLFFKSNHHEDSLSLAGFPLSKFIPQLVTEDGIGWLFSSFELTQGSGCPRRAVVSSVIPLHGLMPEEMFCLPDIWSSAFSSWAKQK